MATLKTKIILRNDSKENWDKSTLKLAVGEIGIENDTGLFKIGDGESEWSALPYANDCERATHYEVEAVGNQQDVEAIAAKLAELGAEAKLDDIAIVKREITTGVVSRTAYVYDGTQWAAMDGNYSASNVYLKDDVVVTTKTGELAADTTVAAGTSLQDMFTRMLSQEKNPTKTDPSVSSFSVKDKDSGLSDFEAGTSVTPKWESTFSAGSYTYKATSDKANIVPVTGTGVTVSEWKIEQDNTKISSDEDGTGSAFVIGDSSVTFKATATYGNGYYALTNLNNLPKDADGNEYDVQISGSSKSKTASLTSYRKTFAGGTTASGAVTSDMIRGLSYSKKASVPTTESNAITFNAEEGDTKVIFAYPSGLTTKTPKFEQKTLGWSGVSDFDGTQTTIYVADARGGENNPKAYTVYTYAPLVGAFPAKTEYRVYFA